MIVAESSPHLHEAEPHGRKPSSFGPTSIETAVRSNQPDDICTGPNCTEGGSEMEDRTTPDVAKDQGVPTCGQCKGGLSFPIWYCIFCEDNLFICDACDGEDIRDLVLNSGKHTNDHHLIRCLAPEKENGDEVSPTDQRLTLIEGRLDEMQTKIQTQLDILAGRLTGIENLLLKLTGAPMEAA